MRKRMTVIPALLVLVALSLAAQAAELSAEEIIQRVDANQYTTSVHSVSRMVIRSGRREITKSMETWAVGSEKALVVFTNPADKGTKYLKLQDELWMYFPDAEDLVKISGHMLKQGMMGSDLSYQDLLESEKLNDLYNFKLLGWERYDGVECYVLEAVAKPGKNVSYPLRKLWVDAADFVSRREELYAVSGKLLKVLRVEELRRQQGRIYPSRLVMEDKMKRDSATTLIIDRIEFNVKIADDLFSLRSLMR
jgi:outer membrane lipoprotein-sorting protein